MIASFINYRRAIVLSFVSKLINTNLQTSVTYPNRFCLIFKVVSHDIKKRYAKKITAFGKNLREMREAKGLTQEFIANNAGISVTSITNIENGHNNPTLAMVFAICDVMKVSPKELF